MRTTDLRGQQFGRLFVVSDTGKRLRGGFIIWLCHCKCGKSVEVPTHSLKDGNTKSCGCLLKETAKTTAIKNFSTHGKSKERLYKVWAEMKARCLNSNNNVYCGYDYYSFICFIIKIKRSSNGTNFFLNQLLASCK